MDQSSPIKNNPKKSLFDDKKLFPEPITLPKTPESPTTDYSTIRGKTVLVSPTAEQFDLLKKRLEERIQDSRGETIYEIGIGEGNNNFCFLFC